MKEAHGLPDTAITWLRRSPSAATRKMYANRLRFLRDFLGTTELHAATPADLLDAAARYRKQKNPSAASWNQMMAIWRSYYGYLFATQVIDKNPALVLERTDDDDLTQPTPTRDEVNRIWAVLRNPAIYSNASPKQQEQIDRDRAIFALLTTTGLRNFELIALTVDAFDFTQRMIVFKGKGGRMEEVAWPASADEYLRKCIGSRNGSEPAFWNNMKTNAISDEGLNKMLCQIAEAAGVTMYTAHAYRRYVATEALRHYPLQVVQAMMRHKNPATTVRYNADRNEKRALLDIPPLSFPRQGQ